MHLAGQSMARQTLNAHSAILKHIDEERPFAFNLPLEDALKTFENELISAYRQDNIFKHIAKNDNNDYQPDSECVCRFAEDLAHFQQHALMVFKRKNLSK